MPIIAATALAAALVASPADALGLDRDPRPPVVRQITPVTPGPARDASTSAFFASLAGSVLVLAELVRKRRAAVERSPVTAPQGVRVIFVSGFGSDTTGTFDELMARLDVSDTGALDVVVFDYRVVEPTESHSAATRRASVEEIADGLAATIHAMARAADDPIYLVGHSKGAVAIAELMKRWDLHPGLAEPSVIGAALLDPPMSDGLLGALQSLGRGPASAVPNDGGYTPRHCDLWLFDCNDTRAHLGATAGVEVVVFRNPDSGVANFSDSPPGLRVFDITEPGTSGWGVDHVAAAHSYPLRSPAVAACIADEMRDPGSCEWGIRKWITNEL